MLREESIILVPFDDHVLLLLLKLLFQKVDQVVIAFVHIIVTSLRHVSEFSALADPVGFLSVASRVTAILTLLLALVNFLQLMLEAFNDFLAKVRPFSEFLFDLLVNLDFALVRFNLLLHLVVLENKDFSLLRLVLQLSG
jgi:hypothetical protein